MAISFGKLWRFWLAGGRAHGPCVPTGGVTQFVWGSVEKNLAGGDFWWEVILFFCIFVGEIRAAWCQERIERSRCLIYVFR